MKSFRSPAFTIVELLIIISVLGILVTIGLVGWGTVVTSSQNKTRATELSQWKSTYDLYKSRFAIYPSPSVNGTYCIGNDFPSDRCGYAGSFGEDSTLNASLERVSKLPTYTHPQVDGRYLGPYAIYTSTTIRLVGVFKGDGSGTCPTGTTFDTTSPSGVAYCYYQLSR